MQVKIKAFHGQAEHRFSQKGNFQVAHDINEVEYEYENQRFWFLLDTNIDQSRKEEVKFKLDAFTKIDATLIGKAFHENFFLIAIDKNEHKLHLVRDISGVKTAYYTCSEGELRVGTVMHDLAKSLAQVAFSEVAIHQILYSNYLLDGYTYYEGVYELKAGHHQVYNSFFQQINATKHEVNFLEENNLNAEENFKMLRRKTRAAHRGYLAPKNTVLLSGGLDSIAMLIALDDLPETKHLQNISFRVKDTSQDETGYATDAAQKVNRPITIKEVDPNAADNFRNFEETLLQMNNPYIGVWIFGKFKGTPEEMFYAGQDTRLHTPALNEVDKMAYALLPYQNTFWVKNILKPLSKLGQFVFKILGAHRSTHRVVKNLWKGLHLTDLKSYIDEFYLKLGKEKIEKRGLPTDHYEAFRKHFDFDISKIKTKRALYNKVVEKKWKEQYIFDIRYLQDVARLNQTYIAMPFYNPHLASFSSSIPFDLSMKKMMGRSRFGKTKAIIYKYVLRHAFRDKLTDKCFYRAKAVSETMHQMNNGVLGKKLKNVLRRDLALSNSFIRSFKLEKYVQRYLDTESWGMKEDDYLGTIYYIGALCVYHYRIILKHKIKERDAPIKHYQLSEREI
ncbi:MAG: asparagine synthase-related protein [Bacteroidota bacterium]